MVGNKKWARCNFDGKPIHPGDKLILETFKIWLAMDATDRMYAARMDPEWQKFLGIPVGKYSRLFE